jgi:hypothetical protein
MFKVHHNPVSAYAFLPYGSYHVRHVFRGRIEAAGIAQGQDAQAVYAFQQPCSLAQGMCVIRQAPAQHRLPIQTIDSTFSAINWTQQNAGAKGTCCRQKDLHKFFTQYRCCVFSNGSTSQGVRHLPPTRLPFEPRSALPMGYILPWGIYYLDGAASAGVFPIPAVTPALLNKLLACRAKRVCINSYLLGATITLTGCRPVQAAGSEKSHSLAGFSTIADAKCMSQSREAEIALFNFAIRDHREEADRSKWFAQPRAPKA